MTFVTVFLVFVDLRSDLLFDPFTCYFIMVETDQGRHLHPLLNVTVLISFFITQANKIVLIHKDKSCFLFSSTAHKDLDTIKKAVSDFCGVRSLSEAKGVGSSIDCSFMRPVCLPRAVESF